MKRILASSALAIMMSTTGALADAHSEMFMSNTGELQILGSEFIGARVYVAETEFDDTYEYSDGAEEEWDDVGEINNIVLSRDGTVEGIVVGVGGFLGLGEKDVAVSMDQMRFISDGEDANDYFIVFTSTKAALEGAPEWERMDERMENTREVEETERTETGTTTYRPTTDMAALGAVEREGYTVVEVKEVDNMKASNLIGTPVYGIEDEEVGEIDDIIMSPTDTGRMAVIDVGGFMGIGEKPVAIPMNELRIMRDGDSLRVYIDATEERLEDMMEYEG